MSTILLLLARMPNTDAAADFLTTLNGLHPIMKFTMELPADNMIPFIGIELSYIKLFSVNSVEQ